MDISDSDDDIEMFDASSESSLDEELKEAISKGLEDNPLENLPSPCPVCFFAKMRAKKVPDLVSLENHAEVKAAEPSKQQRKVKSFHLRLLQMIKDKRSDETFCLPKHPNLTSAVIVKGNARIEISQRVRRKDDVKDRIREIHDLRNKKQKMRRVMSDNEATLESFKNRLLHIRRTTELFQRSIEEEIEKEEKENLEAKNERDARLAQLMRTKATVEERLKSLAGQGSSNQRFELTTKVVRMRLACLRMQKERDKQEAQLEEIRKSKNEVRRFFDEARHCAELVDKEMALLTIKNNAEETLPFVELHAKYLSILQISANNLPKACSQCKRDFVSKTDNENGCRRVILGICHCVEYCRDCVDYIHFRKCPKHKVPIGETIPFTTYG